MTTASDPVWRVAVNPVDRLVARMLRWQDLPVVGIVVRTILVWRGTDVASGATFGPGLRLRHAGIGVVIAHSARIGANVTIYHGVTLGRGDVWRPAGTFSFEVGDEVILAANAVILSSNGVRRIGEGAIVGANSVVSCDVPPWEIWAGAPAVKVGDRARPAAT